MAEVEKEKESLSKAKEQSKLKMAELKQKLRETENVDMSKLKVELQDLEKQQEEFKQKENELEKREKAAPWNVDTISKEGFTKTVINKAPPRTQDNISDEEKEQKQREFVEKNEPLLKKYGMLQKYDDSKRFLMDHPHLACEETANYLVIWCINLEMEEKTELMEHVAHQTICMQYVLELSRQLDVDPRACVPSFFSRIQMADKQYIDSFEDEIRSFKQRIKDRVKVKLEEMARVAEEEERQKRLGPGGLDPEEVFESLPPELQKCFEEQDIALLQQVISQMPEEEAKSHMKRCIDSGLWVPDAKQAAEAANDAAVAKDTPAK